MKHDDGSHGCIREEDKKREVAMKLKCPIPKPQTPYPKSLSKPAT